MFNKYFFDLLPSWCFSVRPQANKQHYRHYLGIQGQLLFKDSMSLSFPSLHCQHHHLTMNCNNYRYM